MRDVPENELFSAYLDGELTAAEQVEVEQLLAASPAARQLLEELRALSSTLQTMPQHKLGEDLSQPVLRLAERRILTAPAEAEQLPMPAPPPGRSVIRRLLNPRALIWSALAVAVAVTFMLNPPGRDGQPADEEVAMTTETPEGDGSRPSIRAGGDEAEKRNGAPVADLKPRSTSPGPLAGGKLAEGAGVSKGRPEPGSGAIARRPSDFDVATKPMGERGTAEATVREKSLAGTLATKAPDANQPTPAGPTTGGARPDHGYGVEGADESDSRHFAGKGLGPVIGKGDDLYKQKHGGRTEAGFAVGDGGATQLAVINGRKDQLGRLAQAAGVVWLVQCDISPKAARSRLFHDTLLTNGIALDDTRGATGAEAAKLALAKTASQGKKEYEEFKRDVGGLPVGGVVYGTAYIEAPPEQIKAALDALKAQPDAFPSVKMEPMLENRSLTPGADSNGEQTPTVRGGASTVADAIAAQDLAQQLSNGLRGRGRWLQRPENGFYAQFGSHESGSRETQKDELSRQPSPHKSIASTPEPPQTPAAPPAEPAPEAEPPRESAPESVQTEDAPSMAGEKKLPRAPADRPARFRDKTEESTEAPAPAPPVEPVYLPRPTDEPAEAHADALRPQGVQRPDQAQRPGLPRRGSGGGEGGKPQEPADHQQQAAPELPTPEGPGAVEGQPSAGREETALGGTEAKSELRERLLPQQQRKLEQLQEPAPISRVFFVLRLVGPEIGDVPPAAVLMREASEAPAAEAAPAEK